MGSDINITNNQVCVRAGEAVNYRFGGDVQSMVAENLGPCVCLVALDDVTGDDIIGAMYHVYTDLVTERELREELKNVLSPLNLNNAAIAIAGGMTRNEDRTRLALRPSSVADSQRVIDIIRQEVERQGGHVVFEDVMGKHQRNMTLRSDGNMQIDDVWQEGEGRYPITVNLFELRQHSGMGVSSGRRVMTMLGRIGNMLGRHSITARHCC